MKPHFTGATYDLTQENMNGLIKQIEDLQLQVAFVQQYLNPADTSFRKMIDTFRELSPADKDKIINLTKALAAVGGEL